jgi:hypothetical protein
MHYVAGCHLRQPRMLTAVRCVLIGRCKHGWKIHRRTHLRRAGDGDVGDMKVFVCSNDESPYSSSLVRRCPCGVVAIVEGIEVTTLSQRHGLMLFEVCVPGYETVIVISCCNSCHWL